MILEYFGEARARREELAKNPELVDEILRKGAEKARAIASKKISEAKKIVGLMGNIYK